MVTNTFLISLQFIYLLKRLAISAMQTQTCRVSFNYYRSNLMTAGQLLLI